MYRTGDLVKWTSAGELVFLDRADSQVKVRGFRVELGEIEAVLAGQDDVAQVAVVVQEDRPGDRRLVGYVVAAADRRLDLAKLRDAVAQELPGYMVPAALVELAALPVLATGKLNRNALPTASFDASDGGREPNSVRERTLCEMFAQVLNLDRVGPDDSFFDRGGHSLLAATLLARIGQRFGVKISLRAFLDSPSASGVDHYLDQ